MDSLRQASASGAIGGQLPRKSACSRVISLPKSNNRFTPYRSKRGGFMAKTAAKKSTNKPLSKSAILEAVTNSVGEELSRKQVKLVVETLMEVGHKELKKNGIFVLPGFAKFVVVKKPARPAREGIDPFTKQKRMFAAKPASKGVRARPVKAIKDAVM